MYNYSIVGYYLLSLNLFTIYVYIYIYIYLWFLCARSIYLLYISVYASCNFYGCIHVHYLRLLWVYPCTLSVTSMGVSVYTIYIFYRCIHVRYLRLLWVYPWCFELSLMWGLVAGIYAGFQRHLSTRRLSYRRNIVAIEMIKKEVGHGPPGLESLVIHQDTTRE